MATFALLIWPFIALIIFAHAAAVPAIIAATVIPYLFLPESFSIVLPAIPDLDKRAVISIGLVSGLLFFGDRARKKENLPRLEIKSPLLRFMLLSLLMLLLVGSILTVMNNGEMLYFGSRVLPAMRAWDVVARLGDLCLLLIPFLIAYMYCTTPQTHRALLKAFVISGIVYSILMLVEIRLSPQLHNWVYGYHQHSFLQHIRDGYRPKVFLYHGLWVGFFIFMALIAAATLWKCEQHPKWLWAGGWLFIILMVSKNLGAFLIALMCLVIFFGVWRKMQMWIIILIALLTLTYPALRQASLIPLEQILNAAEHVSEERAWSLEYRLINEDQLLERALRKPFTGWGGWSRDRIFNEWGEDISVSEGRWIQVIGAWGWIGYVGLFGLLTLPLITMMITSRRKEIPSETIALALICTGNLIYMIPNATLTPIGLLCFGALAGFAQFDIVRDEVRPGENRKDRSRGVRRYTRFRHI